MKVKKGVGISAIKGKLGGFIIQDPTVGTTLRVKSIATYPKSLAQFTSKALFVQVNASWRNLTPVQQAAWVTAAPNFPRLDQFGIIYYLTGFELFSYINNDLIRSGFAPFVVPPVAGVVPDYTALSWTTDPGVNLYLSPTPGLVPADNICEIWATPALSRGRSYYDAKFRLLGHFPAGSTAPLDITAMYEAVYGPIINTWSVILCRIRNLMTTTGQVNSAFFQTNIYLPAMCPDPNIFIPDTEWPAVTVPAVDHIKLLCSDMQSRNIAFYLNLNLAGNYTVDVYGAGGALLYTQTLASGTMFQYQFTAGTGYPATGYTTFILDIYPVLATRHPIRFNVTSITDGFTTEWQILYARFNTPTLTSLDSAFTNIKTLQSVAFDSTLDLVTTMYRFNYNGFAFKSTTLPSMNLCTSMDSAFYGCFKLTSLIFPATLPKVASMRYLVYQCSSLPALVFPADLPELTTMESMCDGCQSLVSVTMPVTAAKLITLISTFNYCRSLKGIIYPVSLPKVTSMNACHMSNYSILSIALPTSMPLLTNLLNTFYGCYDLLALTFPATLNTVTTAQNMCYNCWSLISVSDLTMQANTTFSATFQNCYSLLHLNVLGTAASVTTLANMFTQCRSLIDFTLPATMNAVTTIAAICSYCYNLTTPGLPTTMNLCTTFYQALYEARKLVTFTYPANLPALQLNGTVFYNCQLLTTITFPANLPAVNNIQSMAVALCPVLNSISATTFGAVQVNAQTPVTPILIPAFDYVSLRVSRLEILGSAPALGNAMTHVDIDWVNSLYAGTSPQIKFAYMNLDDVEIDRIFTALPVVVGKTINVVGCTGAPTCHPAIATAKGWTVVVV